MPIFKSGNPTVVIFKAGVTQLSSKIFILSFENWAAESKSNEIIELFALCLQTSALTSKPHIITGTLNINDSNNNNSDEKNVVTIDRMSCSCKAGTSQSCKHIVGVLVAL